MEPSSSQRWRGSKGGRGRNARGRRGGGSADSSSSSSSSTEHKQQGNGRAGGSTPRRPLNVSLNSQAPPLEKPSLESDAKAQSKAPVPGPAPAKQARAPRNASVSSPALSSWSAFATLWSPGTDEAAAVASLPADEVDANVEAQRDELTAIAAIYERELRIVKRQEGESSHSSSHFGPDGAIDLEVSPAPEAPLEIPQGSVIEVSIALDNAATRRPAAHVSVPPELRKTLPSVHMECTQDGDEGRGSDGGSTNGGSAKPKSSSGQDGGSQLPLSTLPPLSLRLRLPATYPSVAPPVFGVRCAWLSDASLEALCRHLDGLCAEAAGGPVVCELIEWLRSDALEALPPETLRPLLLPAEPTSQAPAAAGEAKAACDACASRAARWPRRPAEVLSALVAHAQAASDAEWRDSLHDCGVCLETHASIDCLRFVRCKHTFCRACCTSYFESQMADGAASALSCPEPSCRQCATPPEVKMLLPTELYEQYERLSLQTTLETMSDICWCPRCEYPAFLLGEGEGEGGRLALCSTCHLSFCIECKQSWHGLAPCANLATRWRNASEAEREVLRQKYGDKVVEEVQSGEWLLSNTKPCPNCNTSIQKNGGCNHISCRKCNYEWCWLCNKRYHAGHFKTGSCEQFSDDFFEEINLSRDEFAQQYVVLNHW